MSKKLVELPCIPGDTIYRVTKQRGQWVVLPREVVSITYRLDHFYRVVWEIFSTTTDVLGKSCFLTEKDANDFISRMTSRVTVKESSSFPPGILGRTD